MKWLPIRRSVAGLAVCWCAVIVVLPRMPWAQRPGGLAAPPVKALAPAAAPAPQQILSTNFRNPPFDTSKPTWARDICRGKKVMSGAFPPYEWMQVFKPSSEEDLDVVGLSGTA